MIALATAIAFASGLVAGLPQIVRMVRCRSSESQSALGWAIGAKGALATTYVGVAHGVTPVVYAPSAAGGAVAAIGLGVTLYFRPRHRAIAARVATPIGRLSRVIAHR
jgi:lysozyme family protein